MNVFISYSSKDIEFVRALHAVLRGSGIRPYFAEYDLAPGQELAELRSAIQQAHMLVLVWSEHARASEWVTQEVGIAMGSGRLVLPVVLNEGLGLPGFLRDIKYVAAWRNPLTALPTIQHAVIQWWRYLEEQQRARDTRKSQEDFWAAVRGGLAVVGGVVILDKLFGSDRPPDE